MIRELYFGKAVERNQTFGINPNGASYDTWERHQLSFSGILTDVFGTVAQEPHATWGASLWSVKDHLPVVSFP